jgi:hypothetical protein
VVKILICLQEGKLLERVLESGGVVGGYADDDYPYSQVWTSLIISLDYLF